MSTVTNPCAKIAIYYPVDVRLELLTSGSATVTTSGSATVQADSCVAGSEITPKEVTA